ncbi:aspartate--tRNA ligase [bacterium]|nr:aspartate--tRNA ligase [bacterium]
MHSVYRTHSCAELRLGEVGAEVTLSGWIMRKRDHGGVLFVDLRDHYGVTQVVFHDTFLEVLQEVRVESVITITGVVRAREDGLRNEKLETGEIEVHCEGSESRHSLTVQSPAEVLPFQVAEDDNAPESIRLQQRFLELRREKLHANMIRRSEITNSVREILQELGFREYQTPILTSSSPEGARDYIVPSRRHPGKFYALPQAPQQFKQLLMVSGFDRYFQIAPCFRDEDARADRSPGEFYQIDMELSFVEQDDVLGVNEALMSRLFKRHKGEHEEVTETPFPRIPYDECLSMYGSDKPDLRNPLKIRELSAIFENTNFKVFRSALDANGAVCAIPVPVGKIPPRKYFDDTVSFFQKMTGQGLAYLSFEYGEEGAGEIKGSVRKFFSDEELEALRSELAITETTSIFFAAGGRQHILPWLGKLRDKLGKDFSLLEENAYRFCWVTDYPMYELDETTGKIDFGHNPFSMPQGGEEALASQHPLEIKAHQYDLVCNGYELGSGAIRNHQPETMYQAFEKVGYSRDDVEKGFGGMLRAFRFGAPPHGGIAHGLERIIMLLCGEETIRDVILFPLAQTGEDLLMGAPSEVRDQQLQDVHIQLAPSAQEDLKADEK